MHSTGPSSTGASSATARARRGAGPSPIARTGAQEVIRAEGLVKRYGAVLAVDGVGFTVGPGEIVGFLGPNGAGKSTTMKLLTGSLWPDAGSVRVCDLDVRTDRRARACLGYLPEHTPLYRGMRVARYLDFVAEVRGLRAASRRDAVDRVLADCDLVGWENRRMRTLSKGYRQRVGLAQALVGNPELLVLDEPTSGLDPAEIVRIRVLVQRLAHEKTILLSTHVLSEVQELCARVIILAGGRLIADGDPLALAGEAAERYVVEVGTEPESARAALAGLDGVLGARPLPGEVGRARFELEVAEGSEIGPSVARLAVDRGWELFALSRAQPSLERFFLERVRAAGAHSEPDSGADAGVGR